MTMSFNPTLEGLKGYLTTFGLKVASKPTEAQALQIMEMTDAAVSTAIGPLTVLGDDRRATLTQAALGVVYLGTAAQVYDIANPEVIEGGRSYGQVLWDRYMAERTALAAAADKARETTDTDGVDDGLKGASAFGGFTTIRDTVIW